MPKGNRNGFTPTERKILEVLSDGRPHSRPELKECLWDELAGNTALPGHISNIRKHLRGKGEDIICVYHQRSLYYQHVRLLVSPYDGRD